MYNIEKKKGSNQKKFIKELNNVNFVVLSLISTDLQLIHYSVFLELALKKNRYS